MTTQTQSNDELTEIQKKRLKLREYSERVKPLIEEGEFEKINDAIIATIHTDKENTDFRTFNQWRKDGFYIIKGSKAFLIWGKPRVNEKQEKKEDDEKEKEFYPVAYLFSNKQVIKKENADTE